MEHGVHSFMDMQLAAFFHRLFVWIYPALILLNRLFPSLLKNSQLDQGLPPHLQWVSRIGLCSRDMLELVQPASSAIILLLFFPTPLPFPCNVNCILCLRRPISASI